MKYKIAKIAPVGMFLFTINILLIVLLLAVSNVQPNKYNEQILQEPYNEYSFTPLFSHQITFNSELPYLYVNTSPTSLKYYFTWLKDEVNLQNKSSDYLFHASKKVSELSTFGNSLAIKWNFIDNHNFREVRRSSRPRIWKLIFNDFGSWESTLARFTEFLDLEVQEIEAEENVYRKIEKLNAFQNFIYSYERDIDISIYNLHRAASDKEYLSNMAEQIFTYYHQYIADNLPVYNPSKIDFLIQDIALEKNNGIYDITIDSNDQSMSDQIEYVLKYNNQNYVDSTKINNKILSPYAHNLSLFKDITIDQNSKKLTLILPNLTASTTDNWQYKKNDDNDYVYFQDIVIKKPDQRYYLNFEYSFPVPVKFQFMMISNSESLNSKGQKELRTHEDKFADAELPPSKIKRRFKKTVDLYKQKTDILTRVTIISKTQLTEGELKKNNLQLTPVYEPTINLERTSYIPNTYPSISYKKTAKNQYEIIMRNTSAIQEANIINSLGFGWKVIKVHNWGVTILYSPSDVIKSLLVILNISFVILLFKRSQIIKTISRIIHLFKLYFSKAQAFDRIRIRNSLQFYINLGTKFRLYILLASVFNILYFILLVKRDQNDMLPVSLLLWIVATAVYHIRSYIHYIFATILFTFCAFTFILQLDAVSEKSAIWGFFFITTGVLQAILEYILRPAHMNSLGEFIRSLANDTKILSGFLYEVYINKLLPWFMVLKGIIYDSYKIPAHTLKEKVILYIKIGVTIIVILLIVVGILAAERYHSRLGFNPNISSSQPSLVYPSTLVVIKGRNFGWKQHERVFLKYEGGEIVTNFWSDSKIIFAVPLNWNPGEVTIWIEKPTQWEGKVVIAKSELQKLKILPRDSSFTEDDDMFFKKLKEVDYEVRKINGYE